MSGQAGARGYLVQSLVCILEMLTSDEDWTEVTLEPNAVSEKIDILWQYKNGRKKATQIKSSKNLMDKSSVEGWARELKAWAAADEYELRLIGPASRFTTQNQTIEGVSIPTPLPLNLPAFIDQAAHKLDQYLESKGVSKVPAFARELLVHSLTSKLMELSTHGHPLSLSDLDTLLSGWLLVLYPETLNKAVEMQCEALWNTLWFPRFTEGNMQMPLVLHVELVNDGVRTAMIEGLYLELSLNGQCRWYQAVQSADVTRILQGHPIHPSEIRPTFAEFAIRSSGLWQADLLFRLVPGELRGTEWNAGELRINLFGKFADRDIPTLLRSHEFSLDPEDIPGLGEKREVMKTARTNLPWMQTGNTDGHAPGVSVAGNS